MKMLVTGGSGFIGTNLIASLLERQFLILNIDVAEASDPRHEHLRKDVDIMDSEALTRVASRFSPDIVIHLAARVECIENTTVEETYSLNVEGTKNVLEAVSQCGSVKRVIVTSTQFVCGPGRLPESDEDFFPHTIYGESKVQSEKLTREAALQCPWVIIRPVNIWGPFHTRYSNEFWKIASKGLYVHPGVKSPTRTYGYVGNVVWQIERIIDATDQEVGGKVFYVGDRPICIESWVFGFCKGFRGKFPPVVPLTLLGGLAKVGDLISWATKRPFYINSSRLKSMTHDYLAPMDPTFDAFGEPPYSLEAGIKESVAWFKSSSKTTRDN